jgi:thiosulfate dehydrogenase [quinone] large subunit
MTTWLRQLSAPLAWSGETWAFLFLRAFLGLRFLLAGLGKFQDGTGYSFSSYYDGFVSTVLNLFLEKTWLPKFLVSPYLHSIGYVEIVLGLALLAGIRTRVTLVLTAATYVSLAFGQMLMKENVTVGWIGIHLALTVGALVLVRHNRWELCKD